jgi:uncharacterized membrane protein
MECPLWSRAHQTRWSGWHLRLGFNEIAQFLSKNEVLVALSVFSSPYFFSPIIILFFQILTFLSLLPHVPLHFTKTDVLHYDLKKDAINEFGIKYWTSNPVWVTFQEHGSSFYVNIEEKVWLLVKKNTDLKRLTGRLKLRFLTEIGRFHWNQGEDVTHFTWFGEPLAIWTETW